MEGFFVGDGEEEAAKAALGAARAATSNPTSRTFFMDDSPFGDC